MDHGNSWVFYMVSLLSSSASLWYPIFLLLVVPQRKREAKKRKRKRRKEVERKEKKVEQRKDKGKGIFSRVTPHHPLRPLGSTPLGNPPSVLPAYKWCIGLPLLPADTIYTPSAWVPKSFFKNIQFLSSATTNN